MGELWAAATGAFFEISVWKLKLSLCLTKSNYSKNFRAQSEKGFLQGEAEFYDWVRDTFLETLSLFQFKGQPYFTQTSAWRKSFATYVIGLKLLLPFNWDFSFTRKKLGNCQELSQWMLIMGLCFNYKCVEINLQLFYLKFLTEQLKCKYSCFQSCF